MTRTIALPTSPIAAIRTLLEAIRHQALLAQPAAGRATEDALCVIYERTDNLIAELAVAVRSDEDDASDATEMEDYRRSERTGAWPTVEEWANGTDRAEFVQ